jgi:hypothetical protein
MRYNYAIPRGDGLNVDDFICDRGMCILVKLGPKVYMIFTSKTLKPKPELI